MSLTFFLLSKTFRHLLLAFPGPILKNCYSFLVLLQLLLLSGDLPRNEGFFYWCLKKKTDLIKIRMTYLIWIRVTVSVWPLVRIQRPYVSTQGVEAIRNREQNRQNDFYSKPSMTLTTPLTSHQSMICYTNLSYQLFLLNFKFRNLNLESGLLLQ